MQRVLNRIREELKANVLATARSIQDIGGEVELLSSTLNPKMEREDDFDRHWVEVRQVSLVILKLHFHPPS